MEPPAPHKDTLSVLTFKVLSHVYFQVILYFFYLRAMLTMTSVMGMIISEYGTPITTFL